ncbi:hypothetical protein [Paraburkholderia sp.]|uniref:hypothetical protein n=1 Tax=Paraburkholderia sp. TaxID=1926495 RepID=UPI0025DA6D96|nr:hypothetical protein [Paraburkholderia sp.]
MSAKQVLALLSSHVDGDEDQLLSIALQIAAQEARQGRQDEADKLKRRCHVTEQPTHSGQMSQSFRKRRTDSG